LFHLPELAGLGTQPTLPNSPPQHIPVILALLLILILHSHNNHLFVSDYNVSGTEYTMNYVTEGNNGASNNTTNNNYNKKNTVRTIFSLPECIILYFLFLREHIFALKPCFENMSVYCVLWTHTVPTLTNIVGVPIDTSCLG
jgi:hypothetical protein